MNRWMSSTTGCNNLNAITMIVHDVLAVKCVYDVVAVINYGIQIQPNKIGCVGCLNEGMHADENCPVRPCVMEKKLESCSHCEKFDSCEHLKSRMEFLDHFIPKLKDIPVEDFEHFVKPFQSKARMLKFRKAFLRKSRK